MPTSFVSDRTARVRRNPWIMGLATTPLGLACAAVLSAAVLQLPQFLAIVPHLLIFGTIGLVYAYRKNACARELPARVEAGEHGVRIDGATVVAKSELKSGVVIPRLVGGPIVRLRRRGVHLPVEIRVSDREEGRRLLSALGFDASQSVATFSLPSMAASDPAWRRRIMAGMFGVLGLVGVLAAVLGRTVPNFGAVVPLFMFPAIVAAAALSLIRTKLLVGADGLHLSWLKKARFLPYGEIARIDPYEEPGSGKGKMAGLRVVMKSGEEVRIAVQQKRSALSDEVNIISERISEAIETWSRGEGVAHAALVRRGGREAGEWVRALRGIGAFANVDARTAPVLPEKLWRIVEDPAAPADARAGAAVALGMEADGEARARLRAAAAATAAPKLRVAIESAAGDGPDEALVAALAEVEGEEAGARKRA